MKKGKFMPFVVRCVKEDEQDKYVVTCGQYLADAMKYNTQEAAEATLKRYENLPWEAIGAFVAAYTSIKEVVDKEKIETK